MLESKQLVRRLFKISSIVPWWSIIESRTKVALGVYPKDISNNCKVFEWKSKVVNTQITQKDVFVFVVVVVVVFCI